MRLLLVSQDFPPNLGGTQTYAYELARNLAPRCERFAVLAPAAPNAKELDERATFAIHRVNASHDTTFFARMWHPLRHLLKTEHFDTAFHVQWSSALATVALKGRTSLRHVFVAAHGRELLHNPYSGFGPAGAVYDYARSSVLRRSDGLFAVSNFTHDLLVSAGIDASKIRIVSNGTDVTRFKPIFDKGLREQLGLTDAPLILTVCRLVPRKGIDLVIRSLSGVRETIPDVQYLVVGTGPDEDRLRRLAVEAGVGDAVRFFGSVPHPELPRLYNACDVFAMPARYDPPSVEGFGIVFLEANACGKPVIGARSGGIPDAVVDGETGILIESGHVGQMTDALVHILSDPAYGSQLGEQGRMRVEQSATWKHVATRLYDGIESFRIRMP